MSRPPRTLVEQAAANLQASGIGPIKATVNASRVCATIWSFARCAGAVGHWPTQMEYAKHWGISDRNAQREWALFRQAFPGEETPEGVARHVHAQMLSGIGDSPAAAMLVEPPQELLTH